MANERIPHTKMSDTLSLAQNCSEGYRNDIGKPNQATRKPKSKTIDLKSASGIKADMAKLTIVNQILPI